MGAPLAFGYLPDVMRGRWQGFLTAVEGLGAALLLAVAAVFACDVFARYALGATASWIVDLEWYLTAASIACGLAPALMRGAHVRVDALRDRFGPLTQRWIDVLGGLLLLLPWCGFVVYAASRYAYNSFLIGEGSPDPGGLPYRWLIKMALPFAFALLGVEGVRQLWRAMREPSASARS